MQSLFPGNVLTGMNPLLSFLGRDFSIPGLSSSQAVNSAGFDASIKALLYANSFAKQQSDFGGSITTIGDVSVATDSGGRVVGVFGGPPTVESFFATMGNLAGQVLTLWNSLSFEQRLSPQTSPRTSRPGSPITSAASPSRPRKSPG